MTKARIADIGWFVLKVAGCYSLGVLCWIVYPAVALIARETWGLFRSAGLMNLEHLIVWVGCVVATTMVLAWIWLAVDSCLTYASGSSAVTPPCAAVTSPRASGPSTVRKPVQSTLVTFHSRSIH